MLIDVTLPGIDGRETARRIRALAGTAALTPIIGITGRSETGDEDAARRAGMNAYLRKPISPSALREALAAVATSIDPAFRGGAMRNDERAAHPQMTAFPGGLSLKRPCRA